MFILMFVFVVCCSMSEHGVIGVLCSDQQGLALSGQFRKLMFIDLHLTFAYMCFVVNTDFLQFEVV